MQIITGVGRCGTSFLIKYCKEIGLNIGNAKWIKSYNAGLEDRETIIINEHILKHGYDSTAISMLNNFPARDVIKDPRFLIDSKLIGYWKIHFPELQVIWLSRDPNEIAASQKRKPNMTCPAFRCFPELIEAKETEFIKTLHKENINYSLFIYPNFLKLPKTFVKIFGGSIEKFNSLVEC